MIVKAYAKLNLTLSVKGVLENGYHDLEMINTRIDLYDKIIIKKSKKDVFKINPIICEKDDNIGYKAYLQLKEKFNIKNNYYINIIKNIPVGAGLGGGSADAAAIIKGILELENISIKENELIEFANSIGADVPYCLYNSKCIVKGTGNIIEPININKEWNVILASPALSFSTKRIFELCGINDSSAKFERILANLNTSENYFFNDLEKAAKTAYPEYKLDNIIEAMKSNKALTSLMTGSGSNVFGLFDIKNKKDENNCLKELKNKFPEIKFRKCKTISY